MSSRLKVLGVVAVLVVASFVLFAAPYGPSGSSGSQAPSAGAVTTSAATPSIWYNYSDFFNVPYGEWWDMRTSLYGDEPVHADCFNQTAYNDGTCTTRIAGWPSVASYPYMDWAGSGNTASEGSVTSVYAPYRADISAYNIPGYNLSEPIFLPVENYAAAPGSLLTWNWSMQYLDKALYTTLTSKSVGCFSGSNKNDGYMLRSRVYLTMDAQEAERIFGVPTTNPSAAQTWWNSNTNNACGTSGALETTVNDWFANQANTKYDIFNGYDAAYTSLYTNITAVVESNGVTHVYLEHGAWGTEILLDRWFYWGNATYAGNQMDSSKAAGWWGMENGWWEGVQYSGSLSATAMNFHLNGVLQYHFQEHSAPGPDGCLRQETTCIEASPSDDTPYWTWGPMLVDYVPSAQPKTPYSELDRFANLNYLKTTPGSGDYGTNTSFDYTPISWAAKAGEWWNFYFPTGSSAFYQNPATSPLGTDPQRTGTALPTITSTLWLDHIFPAGYGTWTAATNTWSVVGGTAESWPPSTGPGTYPYIPYPGIYLEPGNLPPGVTTDPATSISSTAATLNGTLADLGSTLTVNVGFLWGTSPTLAGATNVTVGPMTAPGTFSHPLTGLTNGVTYYFEAWADGTGFAHGAIMSFNTGATPPTVTTLPATTVNPTAATLNGNLAGLGTATSVHVGFLWGTSATLAGAANDTVGTETGTGTFSESLSALTPNTLYYFEAWANGTGFAHGVILSFTTPTTYPQVTTDPAGAVITTGANLNGHTTSLGTASSVDVGFLWGLAADLSGATNVTAGTQTVPGAFTEPVSGLASGTTYYFEAWANGTGGFGHGTILSFTTGTAPPSPPTVATVAATSITISGATLNGATSAMGSSATIDVGFLYGTASNLAGATNATVGPQTAPGSFSLPVTGLSSGTTYYFEAWANGTGGFATGSVLHFATATPTPTAPSVTTVAASGITTTGATVNGNLGSLGTATSVTVGFLWGTASNLAGATNRTVGPETATGAFSAALTSLASSTTYYFEAWANGTGYAHGAILHFTTAAPPPTPPSVTTVAASAIATTAATVNGNLVSLGSGSNVIVGFLWGTSSTLSSATNVTVDTLSSAGTFLDALLGLTPSTTYYFEAWANGTGFAHGAIMSFTTSSEAPPEATFLGLPAAVGYAVLAVIIIVIAVVLLVLLTRRRRKSPPESPPESPPTNP